MDNKLDDYGAAFPGFLILNPKLLAKLKATHVKLWIHAHECGHQFRGPDEETADESAESEDEASDDDDGKPKKKGWWQRTFSGE